LNPHQEKKKWEIWKNFC